MPITKRVQRDFQCKGDGLSTKRVGYIGARQYRAHAIKHGLQLLAALARKDAGKYIIFQPRRNILHPQKPHKQVSDMAVNQLFMRFWGIVLVQPDTNKA